MRPEFSPGKNIAIKTPSHEFDKTVHFYKDILGLEHKQAESPDEFESVVFQFGDKNLWVDKISGISQAEIWLEIETENVVDAQKYLVDNGCSIRNELEPLPTSLNGFWLSSPSNIVHLVVE